VEYTGEQKGRDGSMVQTPMVLLLKARNFADTSQWMKAVEAARVKKNRAVTALKAPRLVPIKSSSNAKGENGWCVGCGQGAVLVLQPRASLAS
jgi:hypothetical protein